MVDPSALAGRARQHISETCRSSFGVPGQTELRKFILVRDDI